MTLVEFLNARLDEDEKAAKAATPGKWGAQPGPTPYVLNDEWEVVTDAYKPSEPGHHVVYTGYEGGGVTSEQNAVHIARNSPTRTLREVAAKRQAIVEAQEANELVSERFRLPIDQGVSGYMLRLIAVSYADHPDYQEAWKP
ncbi:DUF6221 family protein [Nocardiopsis sp. NPDC006139]|uniref:DUF6221 family protein n=1 Tax=Nocardiopsis sp. NPDC006139 TaxID=3154578 RepID=UPI0033A92C94